MVNTRSVPTETRYVVTAGAQRIVDEADDCQCPQKILDGGFVVCPECGTAWGHLGQMWVPSIRPDKLRRS